MKKAFVLLIIAALLWLSGCATITPATDPGDPYGPCADWMPYYYCGH
jgi:uncharacterized protein YceK